MRVEIHVRWDGGCAEVFSAVMHSPEDLDRALARVDKMETPAGMIVLPVPPGVPYQLAIIVDGREVQVLSPEDFVSTYSPLGGGREN